MKFFIRCMMIGCLFSSCNMVGKKVGVLELSSNFVTSSDSLKLKKGDELGVWLVYKSSVFGEKTGNNNYTLAYQLVDEKNRQIVYKSETKSTEDEPKIHTRYKKDEDDEVIQGFEQLVGTVAITKDGVYTFNSKLKNFTAKDATTSIVLRKR